MNAEFLGSFTPASRLPEVDGLWIAFLGRSNVGKSSLINLLTNGSVARVSKTPGRTQTLNLFRVENKWIFGDFPGYGYARVSKRLKQDWERLVRKFLTSENFQYALQIVDSRHPGMDMDLQLHEWLNQQRLNHTIVLAKSDKLNRKERAEADRKARQAFPGQLPLFASIKTKEGKDEIRQLLESLSRRDAKFRQVKHGESL